MGSLRIYTQAEYWKWLDRLVQESVIDIGRKKNKFLRATMPIVDNLELDLRYSERTHVPRVWYKYRTELFYSIQHHFSLFKDWVEAADTYGYPHEVDAYSAINRLDDHNTWWPTFRGAGIKKADKTAYKAIIAGGRHGYLSAVAKKIIGDVISKKPLVQFNKNMRKATAKQHIPTVLFALLHFSKQLRGAVLATDSLAYAIKRFVDNKPSFRVR